MFHHRVGIGWLAIIHHPNPPSLTHPKQELPAIQYKPTPPSHLEAVQPHPKQELPTIQYKPAPPSHLEAVKRYVFILFFLYCVRAQALNLRLAHNYKRKKKRKRAYRFQMERKRSSESQCDSLKNSWLKIGNLSKNSGIACLAFLLFLSFSLSWLIFSIIFHSSMDE